MTLLSLAVIYTCYNNTLKMANFYCACIGHTLCMTSIVLGNLSKSIQDCQLPSVQYAVLVAITH